MAKRIITSAVGIPILYAVVSAGGALLSGVVLMFALVGMFEYYEAVAKKRCICHVIAYLAAFSLFLRPEHLSVIALGLVVSVLCAMVVFHEKISITDVAVTIVGFFYIAFLLHFILPVRAHNVLWVWLIFISAFGSDTSAFFVGRTFGKHKLTKLSPNKTVEGAVGGIVGAFVLGMLYAYFVNVDFLQIGLICAVGAVFSQMGDLAASAIKRSTGIKDFGKLLPGHGGVLDRFDSVLFTAPIIYVSIQGVGI